MKIYILLFTGFLGLINSSNSQQVYEQDTYSFKDLKNDLTEDSQKVFGLGKFNKFPKVDLKNLNDLKLFSVFNPNSGSVINQKRFNEKDPYWKLRFLSEKWFENIKNIKYFVDSNKIEKLKCFVKLKEDRCFNETDTVYSVFDINKDIFILIQNLTQDKILNKSDSQVENRDFIKKDENFNNVLLNKKDEISKKLVSFKNQLNLIKPLNTLEKQAKEILFFIADIYEQVTKKITEDFTFKKKDILFDIDDKFKVIESKDLTNGIDDARKRIIEKMFSEIQGFTRLSESEDLTKIFNKYKEFLNKIIEIINLLASDFKNRLAFNQIAKNKAMFDSYLKTISNHLDNAYKLVNGVYTFKSAKTEAKQVMLYVIDKFKKLVNKLKLDWDKELKKVHLPTSTQQYIQKESEWLRKNPIVIEQPFVPSKEYSEFIEKQQEFVAPAEVSSKRIKRVPPSELERKLETSQEVAEQLQQEEPEEEVSLLRKSKKQEQEQEQE